MKASTLVSAAAFLLAAATMAPPSAVSAFAPPLGGRCRHRSSQTRALRRHSEIPGGVALSMAAADEERPGKSGSKRKAAVKTFKRAVGALSTVALASAGVVGAAPKAAFAAKAAKEVVETVDTIDQTKRLIACGAAAVAAGTAAVATSGKAEITSGFGISTAVSTEDAVSEAVKMASKGVDGREATVAFVSCTVSRDVEEVRKEFDRVLPEGVPISGITSSGSLLTKGGTKGGAVGCLLLKSSKKAKKSFVTAYDYENGAAAVLALKRQMAKPQIILMSSTPGAEEDILGTINLEFPGVPVYGGTAADDELAGDWRVMCRDASSGTGVSLVGVGKSVRVGASMLGPYEETEEKPKATRAEGRRVYEIDGKPAADWVYAWLGDEIKEQYENGGLILPQTAKKPVGIKKPSGECVTAHLAAIGEEGGAKFVDFFAPIPEGAELIIMDSGEGPATGYSAALGKAYDVAKKQGSLKGGDPKAGLLVFCGGMAIAVGDQLDAGLSSEAFSSKVDGLPMLGCTCFGEQAYLEKQKENVQRNLSVGMILFG